MKLSDITKLPAFVLGNTIATLNASDQAGYHGENIPTEEIHKAEVVLSKVDTLVGEPIKHKVVLDVDMPVAVLPSSTRGHHHLFIDKELSWDDYEKLVKVLGEVGILEEGYVKASSLRKHTAVRLPWVKKPTIML